MCTIIEFKFNIVSEIMWYTIDTYYTTEQPTTDFSHVYFHVSNECGIRHNK